MPIAPIEAKRVRLRPLVEADLDAVFGILGDAVTTANVSFRQPDKPSAAAYLARRMQQERDHGLSMWGVEHKASLDLIGLCGFFLHDPPKVELGYVIHASHWGQGYATEAAAAALTAVQGTDWEVFATIRPTNLASLAVAAKIGLTKSGTIEDDRGVLIVFAVDSN